MTSMKNSITEPVTGSQNVYDSTDRQENEEPNKEPNKQENEKVKVKTYANVTVIGECDKQLNTIPTEIDSNGKKVVVFDEVFIAKGSKRWEMTVCGYLMSVNELSLDTNDISALAIRVGKPMVMDDVTATMCKNEVGRYARVLAKVSGQNPFPDDIEIVYKNGLNEVICRKNTKMSEEEGFVEVKNKKIGSKGEKVKRQKFKLNTQPPRTENNKQVKSKEKQVTRSAYQPKKKDVNEGQRKSDGRETQNEGVDKINVEK
nr:hypothetical protein [Tanacetum cinerariifolium]